MSEDAHKTTEGAVLIKRIGRNVLNVGIFLVEVLFLILAGPALLKFFMPVVLGWLIACIANPLVKFLEKRLHIVRKHSSFVVILGAILLIVLGCYYGITALFYEGAKIVERFPTYYATLLDSLNHLGDQLQQLVGRMSPEMSDKIEQLTDLITSNLGQIAGSLGSITVGAAGNVAKNIPSILISFLFTLLFAYFFIAQRDRIQKMARKLVPTDTAGQLKLVWNRLTYALGGYFRAQFKIMGIVGIILFVGFLVMRIEYAVFLALIIAVLDFLPMLGTGTVMIPWALYLVLCGNLPLAAGLVILYAVTQVTRQLIQPKMVSDSIGIDTLTTLVFMFIGWRAAGLIGMIVAVPVGLIILKLSEAGAFDHILKSIKELREDIHALRRG